MTSKIYKLDFDLVKQLAGAGFPKPIFINETSGYREFGNEPDLSELISSFHSFANLEQTGTAEEPWTASVWDWKWEERLSAQGATPEIACAKLWLIAPEKTAENAK